MKSKLNLKSNKKILILFMLFLLILLLSLIVINNKIKSINKISSISSNINNEEKVEPVYNNKSDEIISSSYLSIPAILLEKAPIKNGVDEVILNEYVGHFPSTSDFDGNIGLAAHNRGYKKNYFMNINKLKIGDEIIYKIDNKTRIYKVSNKLEIDSYDWSYLNQTVDNTITLITCIDNNPTKRLVVQAVE